MALGGARRSWDGGLEEVRMSSRLDEEDQRRTASDTSQAPVLICYDGSSGSIRAAEAAGRLFAGRPAIVLYVSGATPEHVRTTSVEAVRQELIEEVRIASRRDAKIIADEGARITNDAGLEVTPLVVEAAHGVVNAILHVARDEAAAAIIVGRPRRVGLGRLVRNSVSRYLVDEGTLPVVII